MDKGQIIDAVAGVVCDAGTAKAVDVAVIAGKQDSFVDFEVDTLPETTVRVIILDAFARELQVVKMTRNGVIDWHASFANVPLEVVAGYVAAALGL